MAGAVIIKKHLRISYITMQFPSPSETFASTDIRSIRKQGHKIYVHSLRNKHLKNDIMIEERDLHNICLTHNSMMASLKGIIVILFKPFLAYGLFKWILLNFIKHPKELIKTLILVPRAFDVFREISQIKPDVVHLFWGHYPSLVGYLINNVNMDVVLTIFLGAYDLKRNYKLTQKIVSVADFVFTHSKVNIDDIRSLGVSDENICLVYRGIDTSMFHNKQNKTKNTIVAAGRLIETKGFSRVIEAFASILIEQPDASLTIIGDGPERKRLSRLCKSLQVEEKVFFMGHLSQYELVSAMQQAEVFLFMSFKEDERLPNVVKEAMACRCFCVVADTPGLTELLTNNVTGLILKQGDTKEAVRIIGSFFKNRDKYLPIINNAERCIHVHFNVDKNMYKYSQVWNNILLSKSI